MAIHEHPTQAEQLLTPLDLPKGMSERLGSLGVSLGGLSPDGVMMLHDRDRLNGLPPLL